VCDAYKTNGSSPSDYDVRAMNHMSLFLEALAVLSRSEDRTEWLTVDRAHRTIPKKRLRILRRAIHLEDQDIAQRLSVDVFQKRATGAGRADGGLEHKRRDREQNHRPFAIEVSRRCLLVVGMNASTTDARATT
jgi:hypothetical protein